MDKLNIGVIGCNKARGVGGEHVTAFHESNKVALLALCDINTETTAELAAEYNVPHVYSDYRECLGLKELDAVVVATPHHLHCQMVVDALNAGKHVLCEKPLAISSMEAEQMIAAARQNDKKLACNFNQRCHSSVRALRVAVERGLLGDVYYAVGRWMSRYTGFMFNPQTAWRRSKQKGGGGILIGRGSHLIDALWYMLGKPRVLSVSGWCSNRLTNFEVDDMAAAWFKLDGGAMISLECSYVSNMAGFKRKVDYELYGTRGGGAYRVPGDPPLSIGRCELPGGEWTDLLAEIDIERLKAEPPASVVEDFVDAVRENRTPLVPGEDAAYIVKLIETAYESAESNREIVLH